MKMSRVKKTLEALRNMRAETESSQDCSVVETIIKAGKTLHDVRSGKFDPLIEVRRRQMKMPVIYTERWQD